MDYKKIIDGFKQIPNIISVGIVKISSSLNFYQYPENSTDFRKLLIDFTQIFSQKIMDLSLTRFIFKDSSRTIIGYCEQETLLLLCIKNENKLDTVRIKIDEFLNALLINS